MLGFINLNKPADWTSHDCVARVRRLLKIKRVGHGGTLDPAATGVLPIAVGQATRLLSYLPGKKAYRAKIRFGVRTATDDLAGEVLTEQSAAHLTIEDLTRLLPQFIGKIPQIPPAYSAIHQGGKRLYELARKGETITNIPVRQVEIEKIIPLMWYPGENPELEIDISCGGGTYIRAIARDLGDLVGVGATLASLVRTESCGLKLSDSISLEQIEPSHLISPRTVLCHLPKIVLNSDDAKRWCQGQKIVNTVSNDSASFVQVTTEAEVFLGVGELVANHIAPKVVFN